MESPEKPTSYKTLSGEIARIFGPPAEELAAILEERWRFLRWKQAIRIIEEAKAKCEEKNIPFRRPPAKFLIPFLEKASLEEDISDVGVMWRNLLVDSIHTYQSKQVVFSEIIGRLSSDDAHFLNDIFSSAVAGYDFIDEFDPDLTRMSDIGDVQSLFQRKMGELTGITTLPLTDIIVGSPPEPGEISNNIELYLHEVERLMQPRRDILFHRYSISLFIDGEIQYDVSATVGSTGKINDQIQNAIINQIFETQSIVFEKEVTHETVEVMQEYKVRIAASYVMLTGFGLDFLKSCAEYE